MAKLRWIFTGCSFFFLAYLLWRQGSQLDWASANQNRSFFLIAFTYFVLNIVLGFLSWYVLAQKKLSLLSLADAYHRFSIAWISRYLPGGSVWQYISLTTQAPTAEIRVRWIAAQLFATAYGLLAGTFWALFHLRDLSSSKESMQIVGFVVLAVLLVLLTRLQPRFFWRWLLSRFSASEILSTSWSVRGMTAFALNLVAWFLSVSGSYWLLKSVLGLPSNTEWGFLFAAYSISTVGAYFTFLTPSGIGIREGALLLLLTQRWGVAQASFVALGTAVCLLIAEMVFVLPALVVSLRSVDRKGVAPFSNVNDARA